jgi:hypothetical protein
MKCLARRAVVLTVVVVMLAAVGRAKAETLNIFGFSGTFDEIQVLDGGSRFQLCDGEITLTAPDTLPPPEKLTISDVIVDLTGFDDLNGGNVTIVDDELIINNLSSGTSAHLAVNSATLTQVLNSPIGVGYVSLSLGLSSSDLETDAGETINLDVVDAIVTMNGLKITTDGSNGTANLSTYSKASASISAMVPEPSTFVLGLLAVVGCGGFCWRRRGPAVH